MLLIKNQRIFHNIANKHLNVLSQTLNIRLFFINSSSSSPRDFISTTPIPPSSFNSSRSHYA